MTNINSDCNIDVLKIFHDKELVKICAPMVRYSKLQFRTLVRKYDCDLCYTPMIMADSFCQSAKARENELSSSLCDTPLITQFAANTVHDFVGAAHMVSPYCCGVDLNCGCPQRWAKQLGVGCIMLEKPELIADMIKQCRNRISKPFTISLKMRLLKDQRRTVELSKQLEKSGVSFLAVHARTSSQHAGDIDVETLKLVVENVGCPVIANGGIRNLEDCISLQEKTNCKGVMVANGLLTNPALFSGSNVTTIDCVQQWLDICYNSTLDETLYDYTYKNNVHPKIPERPPNLTFQCFHHHLVFMLEKLLPRSKRKIFNNLQKFEDVLEYLSTHLGIVPRLYNSKSFDYHQSLPLKYDSSVYNSLRTTNEVRIKKYEGIYDPENSDGVYFKSKLSGINSPVCNLSDMFIEND